MVSKTVYYFSKTTKVSFIKRTIDYKKTIYWFLFIPIFMNTEVLRIKDR